MIGQTVSHYKILDKLGEGGMGVVYRAHDTKLDREVALKFLSLYLASEPLEKERFLREARAASALNHTNITTVYEIDEYSEQVFIAMELVEGKTLKQLIKTGSLPVKQVLEIAIQVCDGLTAAAEKQIVHRDIKSDNILVTSKGQPKIMDFGLAKVKGDAKRSQSGSTAGTAAYMSPEQAAGEEVDHRSDIFSFGVVLYELLTEHLPFKGDHPAALAYSILNEEPAPMARYSEKATDGLQRIVSKALAKDKQERYQHIDELGADLRRERKNMEYARTPSSENLPPTKKKTSRNKILAAGIVAAALITAYLLIPKFIGPDSKESDSGRKMLAVLPFENLGAPDDEYFADGITEEITARLANFQQLGVIARTSVLQYKKSSKSISEIGGELGVDYILEGTIRWQRSPEGKSRVRVTPQLIRVKDATHLWAEVYDENMAEVFQVQSDIAKKVTSALDLALLEPEKKSLEAKPTENVEAYNFYLSGNTYFYFAGAKDRRIAMEMYQKAIELDPEFATAYTRLSQVLTELYWHHDPEEKFLVQAKEAVGKAFQLQPGLPEGHMALGSIYYHDHQYEKALREFDIAHKGLPNNADLLAEIGYVQRRQGKFDESTVTFKKAMELDPRSSEIAQSIAVNFRRKRNYSEAERYFDRAIALSPDRGILYENKAELYIGWKGDIAKARGVLEQGEKKVESGSLDGAWHLVELLDGNYQKALTRLTGPEAFFEGDTSIYYLTKAFTYGLLHQSASERAFYNSARVFLGRKIETKGGESRYHGQLGIAYAGLSRKKEAVQEGKKGVELLPISRDAFQDGPFRLTELAQIYVMVGEYDTAIEQLEYLLSIPSEISVPLLRLDPRWAPLRNNPRFQKLVAGKD